MFCLEIGEGLVKIATTQIVKGKAGAVSLMRPEDLRGFWLSLRPGNRRILLNVPRHLAVVRLLRLPSVDQEEIAKIIRTEVLKHVPYAEEDLISSFRIIEKTKDGYSNVLMAAVPANTIQKSMLLLKESGAPALDSVALSSEALFLWCLSAGKSFQAGSLLVANLDTHYMDMDVIKDGHLVFTRGVSHWGQALASARIKEEIKASLEAYQKESGTSVEKIILTGAGSLAQQCHELWAHALHVPVEFKEQASQIPLAQGADEELNAVSYVGLLGLSLRPQEAQINLLPEAAVNQQRWNTFKNHLTLTAILIGLMGLVLCGFTIKKFHDRSAYLSYINSEIARVGPQVDKTKKALMYAKLVQEQVLRKPLAIDVLNEIYRLTPAEISFNMIDFEEGKSLVLRGTGPSLSEVLQYVKTLEGSAYFENVKIKNADKQQGEDGEGAAFEINCEINGYVD